MTQAEVAAAVGVHPGTVNVWESGKQKPEGEHLTKLATFLEVDKATLIGEEITEAEPAAVRETPKVAYTDEAVRPDDPRPQIAGIDSNAEFWKRYDAIEASGLPEPIRVHKIDALAAALRALAQDKDAAAAERRTRVMEEEVAAGRERTREIAKTLAPRPEREPEFEPRPEGAIDEKLAS